MNVWLQSTYFIEYSEVSGYDHHVHSLSLHLFASLEMYTWIEFVAEWLKLTTATWSSTIQGSSSAIVRKRNLT